MMFKLVWTIGLAGGVATGQTPTPERDGLSRLSDDMKALYRDVKAGTGQVVIPPPGLVEAPGDADNPVRKWEKQLDPEVRAHLERQLNRPLAGGLSQPALVVDDAGHLLVPTYVDKASVGDKPLHITLPDGKPAEATFVGSDRQTNLTVLKLKTPAGRMIKLLTDRPEEGAVMLAVSSGGSAKLIVWTGTVSDSGLIFATDGGLVGIARGGQFLAGAAMRPVVDQLIRTGVVKRAQLGVRVGIIGKDDPARTDWPKLGDRPAMRIEDVLKGSAAEHAGLRTGDLILALAGEPVGDPPAFAAAIADRSGATELKILRNGEEMTVGVELTPR